MNVNLETIKYVNAIWNFAHGKTLLIVVANVIDFFWNAFSVAFYIFSKRWLLQSMTTSNDDYFH